MSTTTSTTTSEALKLQTEPPQGKITYGKLRYIPAGHTPKASPHNFHLPELSEFSDVRRLPLHNLRPVPSNKDLPTATNHAQLATHGFTAVHHPVSMHATPYTLDSWKDPKLLRELYIPETEELVKAVTGCSAVATSDLLLRSQLWTESDALATHAGHGKDEDKTAAQLAREEELSALETGFPQFIGFNPAQGGASPAPKIHLDYAPNGARAHVRMYHPKLMEAAKDAIAAEDNLLAQGKALKDSYVNSEGPRWALYSIWRPLKPVKRDPLALGDTRTFADEDYVTVKIKTPNLGDGREGTHEAESYVARYSEGHRWHWIEDMTPEEVFIIGLWDSNKENDGGCSAGGTLHSSVELEGKENEEARESIELRCLAIW